MNKLSKPAQASSQTPPNAADPPSSPRPRHRRRHFLIDKRRQLKTAALTSGLAFFLLAAINIVTYVLRTSQSTILSSVAPKLKPVLEEQDANSAIVLLFFSVVFIAGVFAITIFQTHLTAGAVFAVKRNIEQVRDGDYQTILRLRPRDSLQKLIAPFNEMVGALRDRAIAEADELDRLANLASSGDADGPALAAALTTLSAQKRGLSV